MIGTTLQRRQALQLGLAAGIGAAFVAPSAPADAKSNDSALLPTGSNALRELTDRLAKAPRRRDFKTVPMILTSPDQWDHEALSDVIAYQSKAKQVWDNTDIASPWLNLMRNALNAQIWSFKHPDFLAVSATHGTAHLALYDQSIWDKYQLAKLAGDKFQTNTLIVEKKAQSASLENYEDPAGAFSPEDNSIPALMSRGVVFMSCHNAIWEEAAGLLKANVNPDKLSHEALAAELTNHLIPGVVLTPGAVGTLPELQQAGFHYAK
ncbi:thiosulfate dehydrogenase [Labrys wisconsinensis]|uniref:Intracellular sulfur oxidation DsrE/DsrF family protein n=1 Tax=Labrys wisconsinensis TaxID=425677 RepID=A0ABU0JAK6_9HYPH|nr:transcriptional initiation protein Tat [Labrys wisconsinensis]MDQ0470222.1 intracellular sulfur oxidation DsrE/DsrF family protein [Labrys wisconsinensis]